MNRRVNRRYQTPLPPDFVHFLIEEQGLSERQKAVVYQLRNKMQDSEWHYQDAKMSKDEFEETVTATYQLTCKEALTHSQSSASWMD